MEVNGSSIIYNYDGLGRIVNKSLGGSYFTEYEYVSIGKRTSLVTNSIKNGNNKYNYKYDKLYNITHIYYNNQLIKTYQYNDFNELIEECDYINSKKTELTYDNFGNILRQKTSDLLTNVVISDNIYTYGNTNWRDQLTAYNNTSIGYDQIGNPISYGNNITMTWCNGRLLNTYSDSQKNLSIQYKYNENDIRTNKIVNNVETEYFFENSNIIYERRGNDLLYYFYDDFGIAGVRYNNTDYYYIKNAQGDIIGILDSYLNQIVYYEYDAFGNVLSIKDNNGIDITNSNHIGLVNPFRYRGYYYDQETNLYYLIKRYYNPTWGRFLNVDGIIETNRDTLTYNLYSSCGNNPINGIDSNGNLGIILKGILIFVGVVTAYHAIKGVARAISDVYLGSVKKAKVSKYMFNKSLESKPKSGVKDDIKKVLKIK